MKKLILCALLAPSIAFAQVPVITLLPIVTFSPDIITLKDKSGQQYFVKTDCDIDTSEIEQFKITGRHLREGSRIKLSRSKSCKVTEIISAEA